LPVSTSAGSWPATDSETVR